MVATDAKDKDSAERADKLLTKENARHDKWMEKIKAGITPVTTPVVTPTPDTKGGAK